MNTYYSDKLNSRQLIESEHISIRITGITDGTLRDELQMPINEESAPVLIEWLKQFVKKEDLLNDEHILKIYKAEGKLKALRHIQVNTGFSLKQSNDYFENIKIKTT